MKLLRELVETIIPQTDTPGAAETDTLRTTELRFYIVVNC